MPKDRTEGKNQELDMAKSLPMNKKKRNYAFSVFNVPAERQMEVAWLLQSLNRILGRDFESYFTSEEVKQ